MHSGRLYALGLTLEVEKQEVHREATEHKQEDVQELNLGMVNDGCQHQIERHQEHDGRDEGGNLQRAQRSYLIPKPGTMRLLLSPVLPIYLLFISTCHECLSSSIS